MADTTDFIAYFSIIADPRVERTKKHRLIDILFIAVCTMICGGEDFTDMELFVPVQPPLQPAWEPRRVGRYSDFWRDKRPFRAALSIPLGLSFPSG